MINTDTPPCILLAAGRGERMRPLTDKVPKPLLKVGGKSLLAWHLENLSSNGIQEIVINHAWLGEMIESTFGNGNKFGVKIQNSRESHALETAGGIRKAIDMLNPVDYIMAINGDIFCPNFPINQLKLALHQLRISPNQYLAHLILVPNPKQHPDGDFYLENKVVLDCKPSSDAAERLTFSGIGLYHRYLFDMLKPDTPTKLAPLLREAMKTKMVSGEKFAGTWHDVGTPQRLQELNAAYE